MVAATLAMPAAKASPSILSILALDLGSTTGWAIRNDRCRILHGTAEFRPTRFEGGGMRYLRFERWLDETRKIAGGIDAVYFEEVRRHVEPTPPISTAASSQASPPGASSRASPTRASPVGTIKRFATGKGNADKQTMIAAIRERGFEPADDNEADAIAILLWAIDTRGGLA